MTMTLFHTVALRVIFALVALMVAHGALDLFRDHCARRRYRRYLRRISAGTRSEER